MTARYGACLNKISVGPAWEHESDYPLTRPWTLPGFSPISSPLNYLLLHLFHFLVQSVGKCTPGLGDEIPEVVQTI